MSSNANVAWNEFFHWVMRPWLNPNGYSHTGDSLSNDDVSWIVEHCQLPEAHPGVQTHQWDEPMSRLEIAVRVASDDQKACMLKAILQIAPVGSARSRTSNREQQIRSVIAEYEFAAQQQSWDSLQAERAAWLRHPASQDQGEQGIAPASSDATAHRDIFISHASEDKEYVRELVQALEGLNISVWFDEFEILPGHSISGAIARGLNMSDYGLVVISPSFISQTKKWTHKEYRGMVAAEQPQEYPIIPVWHGVTHDDVVAYDATLADRYALDAGTLLVEQIAKQINKRIQVDRSIGP